MLNAIDPLLAAAIARDPRVYGYRSVLWTVKWLRPYLYEIHKMKVSAANVRSALARLETCRQSTATTNGGQVHTAIGAG